MATEEKENTSESRQAKRDKRRLLRKLAGPEAQKAAMYGDTEYAGLPGDKRMRVHKREVARWERNRKPGQSLSDFKKEEKAARKAEQADRDAARAAKADAKAAFMEEIDAKKDWQEFPGQTRADYNERRIARRNRRKTEEVAGMLGGGKVYSNSTRKSQYKAG
jgi:hypothetical protein